MLVPCPIALKMAKDIDPSLIAEINGPIEYFHHITIKYGINEYDPEKLQNTLGDIDTFDTSKSAIEKVDYFENVQDGACDCVFLRISEDEKVYLQEIKDATISTLECAEESFPDYVPHITIAYVKKGEGKTIAKELNEKFMEYGLDKFYLDNYSLYFSDGDRRESTIYLGFSHEDYK